MKKFLLTIFATAFTMTVSAGVNMYLSMDDNTKGKTKSFKAIPVNLNIDSDEDNVCLFQANITLPSPLTSANFSNGAGTSPMASFVFTDRMKSMQYDEEKDEDVMKTKNNFFGETTIKPETNRLFIGYTSKDLTDTENGIVSGNSGSIGRFFFDGSSLSSGVYTITIGKNSDDPRGDLYNYFSSVRTYDKVTTDVTDYKMPVIEFSFEINQEEGWVKAVAAPTIAKVSIYKADGSHEDNVDYDYSTPYSPTENSLLITSDANVTGTNVIFYDGLSYTCDNLVIDDNYGFYSPYNFTAANVNYNRTVAAGKDYITICLPFAVSKDNLIGSKVGSFAGLDGNILTFSEVGTAAAYQPYILEVTGTSGPVVKAAGLTGVVVEATIDAKDMTNVKGGVIHVGHMISYDYDCAATPSSDFYAFAAEDNKFHRVKRNLLAPAYRTIIMMEHLEQGVNIKSTNLSELGIKFIDGDETVTEAEIVEAEAGKVNVFDIVGRAVRLNVEAANATEGLKDGVYIVNGQKVIVKNK